jgi:hypothetical protein
VVEGALLRAWRGFGGVGLAVDALDRRWQVSTGGHLRGEILLDLGLRDADLARDRAYALAALAQRDLARDAGLTARCDLSLCEVPPQVVFVRDVGLDLGLCVKSIQIDPGIDAREEAREVAVAPVDELPLAGGAS